MTPLIRSFAALADPTRLNIIEQLMQSGELPAGDLVKDAGMTAPAVSRHLKVLREAGLVRQRIDGTRRLYSANPDGLRLISDWAISRRAFWEQSLDRLETAILTEERRPQ
ncbi:ArsR/SmtB family transcription factor [Phaeobacter marinintestinus]|uniref:ArsR/SmtB family transcription factor n=1 Tax=Falsiphaeobacter marinintestinus TaxID=1492905 RepID=UPI0011B81109|nr:metalloregulator ArsR/SmtB family transcription factor [Phaeobacter marinintestinus]